MLVCVSSTAKSIPSDASAGSNTSADSPQQPATALLELDRGECLRLLATTSVGRLAVNVPAWPPVIRPVNYVLDERSQSVLFRSARGSKFHALLHSARAAFEIDGTDPDGTAWSVIVIGATEEVTNLAEIDRIERLGLQTWAPGPKPHWVRIRATTVSGRRIAPARQPGPGDQQ
jgi:nitroimidazol reductase NimA-like FMN-containing flavoprotein (pyridoxamine 5'-phosphate oxidase superfamily)